jgi:DNA-binding response OmpR family regulator
MNPHSMKHILHVEDDTDTGSMLCSLLRLINCRVTTATTSAEALDKIGSDSFDLYLLDTWLPGGSGVELCCRLRETDATTPVVFYSAAAYDSERDEATAAGVQA